jgi:cyclophilin family peptidyl-prolyl cis-trans isomerase
MYRFALLVLLPVLLAAAAPAQTPLTASDSVLVGRILLAEDRRDSTDRALTDGLQHPDSRIRTIAQRARWRIADSLFAARDSLPPLPPPPAYADPAWRLRYRALSAQRENCTALRDALADSVWAVRFRAAALAGPACAADDGLVAVLRSWVDGLPRDLRRRRPGGVTWQPAAHGVVALARLRPAEARPRMRWLAGHRQWQLRLYAARAAALMSDTAYVRGLVRDPNDNVKEVAIEALAKLTGHADDALYLEALNGQGAQAVRAAAIALKGSPRSNVAAEATAAFQRWVRRGSESERDVRLALLEVAGRPATDDRRPIVRSVIPPRAVALALGEEVRLRVTLAPSSGGGSFVVRLRGDVAPIMAARVLELVTEGYYDTTMWHRVEPDFVIQGAGHGANEYVGHPRFFRDELGTVPHVRGTVGMSTRGHDTGDAQWFVNLKDNLRLNRDYTVFAEVVDGIDVVDRIMEGDVIARIEEVR